MNSGIHRSAGRDVAGRTHTCHDGVLSLYQRMACTTQCMLDNTIQKMRVSALFRDDSNLPQGACHSEPQAVHEHAHHNLLYTTGMQRSY